MHTIISEIFHGLSFTTEEINLLCSKLKKSTIDKNSFLLKEDDEVYDMFYVHKGCLRSYLIDRDGKEHILQFAVKGWWISDYISLYGRHKKLSVSYVECIKTATIYSISKAEFDMLCREIPKVAYFHIKKMELAFASFQNRILENLSLSATQRYVNFVETYPTIVNDVKNYHIASYLGITTESLSRIRTELSAR